MTSSSSSSISIETSVNLALNEPEDEVYSFDKYIPQPTQEKRLLQYNAKFLSQIRKIYDCFRLHFKRNLVSLGSDQSTAATV